MFLTNLLKFTTKKRYNNFKLGRNQNINPPEARVVQP